MPDDSDPDPAGFNGSTVELLPAVVDSDGDDEAGELPDGWTWR